MFPAKTEPMIKNTTHSIGCNGMANNDDYHGLEMYKNHAKDSTPEGYLQPDPTTMESSQGVVLATSAASFIPHSVHGAQAHLLANTNLEKAAHMSITNTSRVLKTRAESLPCYTTG